MINIKKRRDEIKEEMGHRIVPFEYQQREINDLILEVLEELQQNWKEFKKE